MKGSNKVNKIKHYEARKNWLFKLQGHISNVLQKTENKRQAAIEQAINEHHASIGQAELMIRMSNAAIADLEAMK